jgi:hypothetical protein
MFAGITLTHDISLPNKENDKSAVLPYTLITSVVAKVIPNVAEKLSLANSATS